MAAIDPSLRDFRGIQDSLGKSDQVKLGKGDETLAVSKSTLGRRFVTLMKKAFHVDDKATVAFKNAVRDAVGGKEAREVFRRAGIESYKPLSARKLDIALRELDARREGVDFSRPVKIKDQLSVEATRTELRSVHATEAADYTETISRGGQSIDVNLAHAFLKDAGRGRIEIAGQNIEKASYAAAAGALYDLTEGNQDHIEALSRVLHQGLMAAVFSQTGIQVQGNGQLVMRAERSGSGYDIHVSRDSSIQSVAHMASGVHFADPDKSRSSTEIRFHVPFDAIDGSDIDFDQVEIQPLQYDIDFVPGKQPG
jgi:hypothetical protein